jgi:hypothetical protein
MAIDYDVTCVEAAGVARSADNPGAGDSDRGVGRVSRRRASAGFAVALVVVAAAGYAIYRQRETFVSTLKDVGIATALESYALGLCGMGATFLLWRAVLGGLDVRIPFRTGARVFFTSQLGKYVPGSVWPVLMQMEAGRSNGAGRRTMLGGNIIATVLNCAVGLMVACLLLPLYDLHVLDQYWWVMVGLPVLLLLLHPRALPALMDRAFALLHRPRLNQQLDLRSEGVASVWSLASWVALGGQLGLLALAVSHTGVSTLLLCTGGMALAVPLGVLFLPAPAGAGVRDVILVLVLRVVVDPAQALALVVASRVILIFCDVTLAAVAALVGRMGSARLATESAHDDGGRRATTTNPVPPGQTR